MREKIALVTAGGTGMGAAAAKRLVSDGFKSRNSVLLRKRRGVGE